LHPVLDPNEADGSVVCREKFAGAAAKVLPPLYSMASHRIDGLQTTCHAAKKKKVDRNR